MVSWGLPSSPVTLPPQDRFTHTVAILIHNEAEWAQGDKMMEKLEDTDGMQIYIFLNICYCLSQILTKSVYAGIFYSK